MSNRKERRSWKPANKLRIVLESMNSDAKLAEICRREGLSPNLVYQWRKALMKSSSQLHSNMIGRYCRVDPLLPKPMVFGASGIAANVGLNHDL